MKTIRFEDHGQDFLEWDIDDDGFVVASRPFQGWMWCRYVVTNLDLIAGDLVCIKRHSGTESHINYPVIEVRELANQED